jgi:hypothetical protein
MFKIQNKLFNKLKNHLKIILYLNPKSRFNTKDEAFWEEYSRRKAQGGRVPALESQEIIYNKTIHSWKFSDNHALTSDEFIVALRDLEPSKECPYLIVDVREEVEFDIYKLPSVTKVIK